MYIYMYIYIYIYIHTYSTRLTEETAWIKAALPDQKLTTFEHVAKTLLV